MADIHHVALRVSDPAASALFYRETVGLTEMRRFAAPGGGVRSVWLRAGASVLMLERDIRVPRAGAGTGHVLAFRVGDLKKAEADLGVRGITVVDRTEFTLFFLDPDGHRVGLSVFDLG